MPTQPSPDYITATQMALQDDAVHLAADTSPPVPGPPPDNPPSLSAAQKAERLRDLDPAIYLFGSSAPLLGEALDVQTWKVYVDAFLEDLGSPTDPIAKMLAAQLAMAHHAL